MVEVFLAGDPLVSRRFLVDTGADATVFRRVTLDALGLESLPAETVAATGVGGAASLVALDTHLEFVTDEGGTARVNGPYSAFLDPNALDFGLLGRDVLNNFEVIVSYRKREVLLLTPPHGYQVSEQP
jgi:Aspartyl protease